MIVFLMACGAPSEAPPEAKAPEGPLVVYSGRSESLVGPLIERIEEKLGFEVEVQYGKTAELATRFLTEGEESPAAVFFAQDSGHLGVLAGRDALQPLPDALLGVVEPQFRGAEGHWVGTSGRLRVMVYDSETVSVDDLPKKLADLADPAWKGKLGWAPTNSSLHAHLSVLRHTWGEEETRTWLRGVIANEPRSYPKNSPQVKAANAGELQIGWVNHYYLHRVDKEGRRAAVASFEPGDPGNVLMAAGVGIRANTPDTERAQAFVEALLSADSQAYFAAESFEYPLRKGVDLHPDVAPIDAGALFDVDQQHLSDLGPTRTMLQELDLL